MSNRAQKPAGTSREDWASVDVPGAADAEFATARPFKKAFPAQYKSWKKMGRPPLATPKLHFGFRLAADVVNAVGKGCASNASRVSGCVIPGLMITTFAELTTPCTKVMRRADYEHGAGATCFADLTAMRWPEAAAGSIEPRC